MTLDTALTLLFWLVYAIVGFRYTHLTTEYVFSCGDGGSVVAKSYPTLVTPWTVACQHLLSMGIL